MTIKNWVMLFILVLIPFSVQSGSVLETAHRLYLEGAYVDALQSYSAVISEPLLSDYHPEAIYMSAVCYRKLGNHIMSERAIRQLLNEHPDSNWTDNAYLILAQQRRVQDRDKLGDALMLFESVPARYHSSEILHKAWLGAASIKQSLGYHKEAVRTFNRAIALEEQIVFSDVDLLAVAAFYSHPRNPERNINEAIRRLALILELYPESDHLGEVYFWLGSLAWEQGERSKALDYFSEIIQRDLSRVLAREAQEAIAAIHREEGKNEKAITAYKTLAAKYGLSALTRDSLLQDIQGLSEEKSLKPTVSAWHADVDKEQRQATYSGDVAIQLGSTTIQAERAVVDFNSNTISARGTIRLTWQDQMVVHGNSLICHVNQNQVKVTGRVKVVRRTGDDQSIATGDTLTVNLLTGQLSGVRIKENEEQ